MKKSELKKIIKEVVSEAIKFNPAHKREVVDMAEDVAALINMWNVEEGYKFAEKKLKEIEDFYNKNSKNWQ